jgi:hypothetical protein
MGEVEMEGAKLIVELLRSLAWPAVVLMLGFYFRKDLRTILPRLTKAGPTGLEFSQLQNIESNWSGKLKDLPGLTRTKKMEEIEVSIHKDLQHFDPSSRVDLLVRHLAQARLERVFERVNGAIYGSQVALLNALAIKSEPSPLNEAVTWFEEIKEKNPAAYLHTTFERWVGFLTSFDLVRIEQATISITETGRDFLAFLKANQLAIAKPL